MTFNLKKAKTDTQISYQKKLQEKRDNMSHQYPDEGITELQFKHNSHKDKDNTVPFNKQLSENKLGTNNGVTEKALDQNPDKYNKKRDNTTHNRNAKSQDLVAESYHQDKLEDYRKAQKGQDRDTSFWDDYVGKQMIGPKTTIVKNKQESQLANHPDRYKDLDKNLKQKADNLVMAQVYTGGYSGEDFIPVKGPFGIKLVEMEGNNVWMVFVNTKEGPKLWSEEAFEDENTARKEAEYQFEIEQTEQADAEKERNRDLHGDYDGSFNEYNSVEQLLKHADKMQFHIFAQAAFEERDLNQTEKQMITDINSAKARLLAKYEKLSNQKTAQFDDFGAEDFGWPGDGSGMDDLADMQANEADDYRNEGYDEVYDDAGGDDITIEPDGMGGYDVVEHGVYENSSVLAGQPKRQIIDSFDDIDAAKASYPEAEVLSHQTQSSAQPPVSPPSDFDPMDAGEVWGEDEY